MNLGLDIAQNINFFIVFLAGIFSFLSPCVLPLIPIYITYLAGNAKETLPDGNVIYKRKKTFFHTLCFILGICFTFFLLGMSFSTIGKFFNNYQLIFTKIGGIIIIIMGFFQIGLLDFKFLKKERKINFNIYDKKVNPAIAFIMGFTFSFAWTPCVGPTLSSVLILASSSKSMVYGNILVFIYSLGFVIPFLILGLFTTQTLNFFKEKQKFIKYTVKISGVLLIVIGIMTFTGYMNGISSYLNKFSKVSSNNILNQETNEELIENEKEEYTQETEENSNIPKDDKEVILAPDFTLLDQYGNKHTLSDYKGKTVFLNFFATWCEPCKIEMPHIEELYKEYGLNKEDVIILGVANPKSDEYPNNFDESKEDIIKFLNENNYTFPVVFDETGELMLNYYISAFPTTFMIDKNGEIYGYIPGMLSKDLMINVIEETKNYNTNK